MMSAKRRRASDLAHDPKNANQGTVRGRALLAESIDTCGFGRPILVDRHLLTIAGNKTLDEAQARGTPIEVVPTTGDELVVAQRLDLDLLTDRSARLLAYYDNRVPQLDLAWDGLQIGQDVLGGLDLSVGFSADETSAFLPDAPEGRGRGDGLGDLPDPEPPDMGQTPADSGGAPDPVADPVTTASITWEWLWPQTVQATRWATFLRLLARRYPEIPTDGGRVARYLTEARTEEAVCVAG